MRVFFSLVLLGGALARPEAGYSYPQQLSQNQLYQQVPQQQVILSQNQQSSSYQQNLPQLASLPVASTPAIIPQITFQNLPPQPFSYQPQQVNFIQQPQVIQNQPELSQIVQPPQQISLNQASQSVSYQQIPEPSKLPEAPQLVNVVVPQVNLNIPEQLSQPQQIQQLPIITKHVYVHVAPEEPPLPPPVIPSPLPPRKSYKIIFIKAPSQSASNQRQVIHLPAPQPAVEEKTLVYVLVDKPQQPEIVVPTPAPTPVSKPEVYFIKYKANSAAQSVQGSLPIAEDLKRTQQEPISSGESTSSLFSGPSTKYGPPGYQKRNA